MKSLIQNTHDLCYADMNGNVKNLVGNRKFYSSDPEIPVPKSGVPRSDKNPFIIPNTNIKRNTDRYIQITAVLRQYSEMIIPQGNSQLSKAISSLFSFMDNSFNRSNHSFCINLASIHN